MNKPLISTVGLSPFCAFALLPFQFPALALFLLATLVCNAAQTRPNIIIILADDVGYSDLGCYGGEIQTPNLDRLAANGLRFTQFYNTGRCCPTRAALLTGLYSHQAGIGHMTEDRGHDGYRGELNRQCVTIAEVLRGTGYRTYMTGKWHVTGNGHMKPDGPNDSWPLQRGFERFYGTIVGAGNYFDPAMLTRDNKMISAKTDPEYRPARYYYTDALTDHAIRFIHEHHEKTPQQPFFLYFAYTAAHWPLHALEEDIAKYRGKFDGGYEPVRKARLDKMRGLGLIDEKWEPAPAKGGLWSAVTNREWEARCKEVYAAQLDRMDQGIGRLVEKLRHDGLLDNTLIFFLQDNGGCAELIGRTARRVPLTNVPPQSADAVLLNHHAPHLRDGRPVRQGPGAMPGPEDTFESYGEAWANVSNTPFREYKHWVHEGGISTPLIVHWPNGIAEPRRGKLEKQPGHLIDLMATCVDVSGATFPTKAAGNAIKPLEGVSLAPAWQGKPLARKQPIFWEHESNRAVRDGRWKLVSKAGQPWELYDMDRDRTESHDLASQEPSLAADLAAKWDAWAARANVLPLGAWRGRAADGNLSTATEFTLHAGDHLERKEAPNIVGKAFTITTTFESAGKDGVIVAQGGTAQGYTLFVEGGKLTFALRRAKKLSSVSSEPLKPGSHSATAHLATDGTLTLRVDNGPETRGQAEGALRQMPIDGLDVGADTGGEVGDYPGPNTFGGRIDALRITLE